MAIPVIRLCKECGVRPCKDTHGWCRRCYRRRLKERAKQRWDGDGSAWDTTAELELLRDGSRRDFWSFFLYAFGAGLNPAGAGWIDYDIHYPIARWFQKHVLEWMEWRAHQVKRRKYLAAIIHRRVGKTTLLTRAGQLWMHLLNPELSSYTGGEKIELSMRMLRAMKAVLDGSDPCAMFTKLYGDWSTGTNTWTGREIVHAARQMTSRQDPSLGTFAVGSSIVGAHPDAIFYDDPLSKEGLDADAGLFESVASQLVALDPVLQGDGFLILPGTRYGSEDQYGRVFANDGIASVEGMQSDSLEPNGGLWHVYFLCGRDEKGEPTTPKIWTGAAMDKFQRSDPVFYATQIMNDPLISEDNPITKDQIKQCMVKSDAVPWASLSFAICCDTAFWKGISKTDKDSTVMVIHGYPKNGSGDVYIIEVLGSKTWRAEDFCRILVSTVQRYRRQGRRVFAITDELYPSGGKDGSWRALLQNKFNDANEPMPPYHELSRFGNRKIDRIVNAANFWVDGHVRWIEGSPGINLLLNQLTQIGQMKLNPRMHDDYVDAHADAFHPQLYQTMRRPEKKAPWEKDSTLIYVDGMDYDAWDDKERGWGDEVPRPPVR